MSDQNTLVYKDPAHLFVPVEDAVTPKDGYKVMMSRWWVITPVSEIILWRGFSPQCNRREEIAKDIQEKVWPDSRVVFLPIVYLPIREDR